VGFYGPVLRRVLAITLTPGRFRLRHAALTLPALGFVWLMLAVDRLLRCADRFLYPAFEEEEIPAPIFILSNPRSGTTYLHRLLSLDPRFDTTRLWQTFVSSVTGQRLVEVMARADARVGRPLGRAIDLFDRLLFSGWEGIHETGLRRTEEDEMLWLYMLLTPSVLLLFPFPELLRMVRADGLPESARRKVAAHYRATAKRQLHASRLAGRGGRTLLGKAALAGGRVHTLRRALPGLRVVHLVRHPYEAVSSTLSMMVRVWAIHSPHLVGDTAEARAWATVAYDSYRDLHGLQDHLAPEEFVELRYEDLIADPEAAVERIYHRFGLELSDEHRARLRAEIERTSRRESTHRHELTDYGLSEEAVFAELKDVFEMYGFAHRPSAPNGGAGVPPDPPAPRQRRKSRPG